MIVQVHGIEIRPTGFVLGATVHRLDASRRVRPEVILTLKQALRDHHVLVFKEEDLTDEQFKAFATSFGPIFQNPPDIPVLASGGHGVAPAVVRVSNIDGYTGTGE